MISNVMMKRKKKKMRNAEKRDMKNKITEIFPCIDIHLSSCINMVETV